MYGNNDICRLCVHKRAHGCFNGHLSARRCAHNGFSDFRSFEMFRPVDIDYRRDDALRYAYQTIDDILDSHGIESYNNSYNTVCDVFGIVYDDILCSLAPSTSGGSIELWNILTSDERTMRVLTASRIMDRFAKLDTSNASMLDPLNS